MRWIFLLLLIFTIAPGCDIRQREEALVKKETELAQREQQLLLRERSLEIREAQVLMKEQLLDSTLQDSAIAINPALPGQWSTKMVCTQTTCAGSAVGDTKNETWNFSYENNRIIAKAMTGDKLVRTYTGKPVNGMIELEDNIESTATAPATRMVIRLNWVNEKTLKGEREIIREDCKIIYSLQLNK